MKIVSFWQPKGGQGKSTLAINVAGAATALGLKVIIIDRDLQGTSMIYYEGNNLPFEVLSDIPEKAPDVDLVILDHMASDYTLPQPKQLVMPFLPRRSQYAAHIKNFKKAEAGNKNIISVVTGGDLRVKLERDTVQEVKKRGVYEVKRNAVFGKADAEYTTIFNKKFDKDYGVEAVKVQISAILTAILREI